MQFGSVQKERRKNEEQKQLKRRIGSFHYGKLSKIYIHKLNYKQYIDKIELSKIYIKQYKICI